MRKGRSEAVVLFPQRDDSINAFSQDFEEVNQRYALLHSST